MDQFKRYKFWIILLVASLMLISSAGAEPEVSNEFKNQYSLSLEEVSRLALLNNFQIQLAQYDAWIAQTKEDQAKSIYDTLFEAEVNYQKDELGKTSIIFGSKNVTNNYNVGLSKKLPTGTTVEVDLTNERQATNSAFTTSPLTHESILDFTVTQELGKNFFGIQDRGFVKLTLIDIENAEHASLETIESHLANVQKTYWDLALSRERIALAESMLEEAKKLYDLHQEKLKDGLVELPEAIASEANYRKRVNEFQLAQNTFDTTNTNLLLLLNIDNSEVDIWPVENVDLIKRKEDLVKSMKKAFKERQDYKIKKNDIEGKKISLSMKKNNLWPEINLQASLARNGLGDHFSKSVENITDQNNPDFFAGVTINMPLENRKARGELKEAELMKAKSLLELKYIEREIASNVMNQVRHANVLNEVASNTATIAELQERKLQEELIRFQWARSSTDTIIRFQEDLIESKREAIEAKNNYFEAVVDLRKEEGMLLKTYWVGELSYAP